MIRSIALALLALMFVGQPALALDRDDIPRLERLSRELVRDVERVHEVSERGANAFTPEQMRVDKALNRFTAAGERLRDAVSAYLTDTGSMVDAVLDLNSEAEIVNRNLEFIPGMSFARADWERTSRTLARINTIIRVD